MILSENLNVKETLLGKKVWAVIGANDNPDKFGNIIYKRLKSEGYRVYPVNPMYTEVEGDKCYPDLSSLPEKPEVLDMVVSPKRGKDFIEEAARLGIQNIWLQPGTYDQELLALIAEKKLTSLQSCVLVALG
ncbi:MAG TPA: CoA-binding protein [Clostridia bacterium]|nr:CoA-binding protein [Clostridia bacterium]